MLFPIDVIAAILYLSFAVLDRPAGPRFGPGADLESLFFHTAAASLYALVVGELSTRLAAAHLERRGFQGAALHETRGWIGVSFRVFLVFVYVFQLEALGWPGALPRLWRLENTQAGLLAVGLAPYLATLTVSWLSFRRLDNLATPERWARGPYLSFRIRTSLFILLPWLLLLGLLDLLHGVVPSEWKSNGWGLSMELGELLLLLGLFAVLVPMVLVRVWQCRPLPEGALRQSLSALQERAGIRFGRIYLWRLGGRAFLNAAVLGFLRRWRYLLLSEGLVRNL
ncbi:MAG: hypothetical protein V1918_03545, partial [Planctomycetota bacterium]